MDSKEELLRRLVIGELSPEDESVRAALLVSPELADALEEFSEICAGLDRDAALEREALESLGSSEPAPGQKRVATTMADLYASQAARGADTPGKRGAPATLHWKWVAAAAVLFIGLLTVFQFRRDTDDHGTDGREVLMGTRVEVQEPIGVVTDFRSFTWTAKKPPGGQVAVLLWNADSLDSQPRNFVVDAEGVWTPSDEVLQTIPEHIQWQVEVRDVAGDVVATSERVYARLAP